MAVSKAFTDYALKLHTLTAQSAAAVYVDSVQDQSLNSELQTRTEGGDGQVYNTFGSLISGAPVARISTFDLKAFLDECGLEGMLIDADGTHPGVVMYWQKYAQGGTRAGAGNHISTTIKNGILVPRTIEMPHQGNATLSAEAVARQESTDGPLTFNEADDLPSGVYPATSVLWGLGPVDFNSVTIDGLKNASIDFGIGLLVEGGDNDIYPTFVSVQRIQPVITLSGVHADVLSTLTEDGVYYTAEQITFYAKKRAEGGTFVADGTAEHIKFTLGKCRADWMSVAADPKTIDIRLTPWYTAGASPKSPMAINTASAIT